MSYKLNNIKKCSFKNLDSSWITSDFGNRTFWNNVTGKWNTNFHNGIDMTSGSTIVATARGKVTACRNNIQGYTESQASGNYVTLYYGNNVYTTYCHMRYGSVKVSVGDVVECGQELGTKSLPQYNNNATNNSNTDYKVGDKVRFTGTLYRDSYGNGAGQSRTNLEATIYLVNPSSKCSYNINNGLGWVRTEDLSLLNASSNNYYTVVKGDTLWAIAQRFYGNGSRYPEIAKANNISNPNIINVGQKLIIP